jgi:hypothetical protein
MQIVFKDEELKELFRMTNRTDTIALEAGAIYLLLTDGNSII